MFKTFTSTLIVASASARPLLANDEMLTFNAATLPEYVAGLIFGLTGNNDLESLNQCFDLGEGIVDQGKLVLKDFENKEILHAVNDLKSLIKMLPSSFENCEVDVTGDIQKIENWANNWTKPVHMAETIGMNYVHHSAQINQDVKDVADNWHSEDFYASGTSTAEFLTLLLTQSNGITTAALPSLISGYANESVGLNFNLKDCITGGEELVSQLESAISEFKKGGSMHIAKGIMDLKNLVSEIPAEIATCKGTSQLVNAIEDLSDNKSELVAKIMKNLALHRKEIMSDIADFKNDISAKNYFKAGKDIKNILEIAIGKTTALSTAEEPIPLSSVPQFAAGFLKQFVQENDLTQIQECVNTPMTMIPQVMVAVKHLIAKEYMQAFKILQGLANQIPDVIANCANVDDDFKTIVAALPKTESEVGELFANAYSHLSEIKPVVAKIQQEQADQQFELVGEDVAKIVDIIFNSSATIAYLQ